MGDYALESDVKEGHGKGKGNGDNDSNFSNISLRPFSLSDVEDSMLWASDDKVTRFCTWESEDGINFFKNKVIPHPWFKAICLNDKPIGAISVTPNSGNCAQCRAVIGYAVASNYWGKGIATRAVKMVANTIFGEWPHLQRLEATVDVENLASQRVLQKAGFKKEGVLRKYIILKGKAIDVVMFSLLSTDPGI
ncbi:Acetyltransferase (GNAT) domain protein [Melia azedarach]|uniref:Acetyltransferase (GNAT) domain protein n=1 Tax=Melia azedarach TaxID=155640 RepID=A0ACC1XAH7_MELAZ|nr:Acetyltransferase (GNAT) domain protein [Melia azedarach]